MDWAQASGTILAGLFAAWGSYKASKAERNSRPVANGFTKHVMDDLREIRSMMVGHLEAHVDAALQDKQLTGEELDQPGA